MENHALEVYVQTLLTKQLELMANRFFSIAPVGVVWQSGQDI